MNAAINISLDDDLSRELEAARKARPDLAPAAVVRAAFRAGCRHLVNPTPKIFAPPKAPVGQRFEVDLPTPLRDSIARLAAEENLPFSTIALAAMKRGAEAIIAELAEDDDK
jgi:hypothetical protein